MAAATRVYVARLAGIVVYDPNGDQVGRVRDAVARMRPGNAPPRVVGLVVEIGVRRRIFLPIGRVTTIEADAVLLSTGTLNLKRFEKKPGEVLVLEDLLDRRVTVAEPGGDARPGSVVDVGMEQERSGVWALRRLAVRATPTHLGRRGHLRQVDWEQVTGLSEAAGEQGTANLLAVLDQMRAADLANTLQDLSGRRRIEVAGALHDDRLADVLVELPNDDQVEILESLGVERAADVLESMDPDDAADVLAELPEPEKDELLALMEPAEAAPVRRLMDYAPGTAGSIMTTNPVILLPDVTIAEALAAIREPKRSPVVAAQVFVSRAPAATPSGRFLGMVHFQRLLREPPSDLVGGVVVDDLDPVGPQTPISEVTRQMATYDLVAMPVVDELNRLVGVVTVDDVLDHLLPEDWRDRDRA
ncbi:magnesium transporter MgtE N-terminal domain-containing protein [Actinocatenispora thailandica]|uniref:magnesium transporter MgtE N-terminal domain-containing protein n=1 Tax=Actinocatenispora thailandica TaxID=227318 RepID=UPI0019521658|nr:CBS domain-containing protein [Actinocatenispora thailandica]